MVKIKCLPGQGLTSERVFECHLCYSSDSSCQSQSRDGNRWICNVARKTVSLTGLTEGTYCYRATAVVGGISTAVVQDTFNIPPQGG